MNTNCLQGFVCPSCNHTESFYMHVTSTYEVLMTDDGTVSGDPEDTDWNQDSSCRCPECGKVGTVAAFTQPAGAPPWNCGFCSWRGAFSDTIPARVTTIAGGQVGEPYTFTIRQCPDCGALVHPEQPEPKPRAVPVFILEITHRHGSNITAHATQEERDAAAYAYVEENWGEWFRDDQYTPSDHAEVVAMYFREQAEIMNPERLEHHDDTIMVNFDGPGPAR